MKESKPIVFQPFMKFVIEFHNNISIYGGALKGEFPKLSRLNDEEMALLEESFLIKIVAEWESLTQNIVAYCIAMNTSKMSQYLDLSLPLTLSFENAYSILNGLQYKTITSSNELKSLSRKILVDEFNPFVQLEGTNLNKIDDLYAIRNYIAHKSQRSRERLVTMYRNRYNIMNFTSPGLFLTEIVDAPLNICRRDLLYGALLMITVDIWKFLDADSYSFVYEDDSTEDGLLAGLSKMDGIFKYFEKSHGD